MPEVELKTFPSNSAEALAMAYINSLNLSEMTPEKIARLYDDALARIRSEQRAIHQEKRSKSN